MGRNQSAHDRTEAEFQCNQIFMGVSPRPRDGLWIRRFLHYGLCLPGCSQVQAHLFMATATRILELAVNDRGNSPADCCTSIIAAIILSRSPCSRYSTHCGNHFRRGNGSNHAAGGQA